MYRVAERFVHEGLPGLVDRREDNGETKAGEYYQGVLLDVVGSSSPRRYGYRRSIWTQEFLVLLLETETSVRVSTTTMCLVLKRLKIRLGRPKPTVGCPWKNRRRIRRIKQSERLLEMVTQDEVIVYADEVDIHLNPKIGPDYMLRGTQKTVLAPGKNEKRYLAGTLNARTRRLTFVEADRKNSDLYIRQLWQLVRDEYLRARRIYIILDNYKIHSSQHTKLALGALRECVKLHFVPPHCPDHNRMERTWKDLHDNVTRNHICQSMSELRGEVSGYLQGKNEKLQQKYTAERAA